MNIVTRLDEEGYVAPERSLSSPTQTENSSATVIETVTLKELCNKTSTEYLKVMFLRPFLNSETLRCI